MAEPEDRTQVPPAALWLGLAGLVPFVGCSLQIATGWPLGPRSTGPALYLLGTYGAVILSFLGGAHWGLSVAGDHGGVTGWRRYTASVVPALIAWLGLWIGARNGLLLIAAGFAALLAYDLWTVGQAEAPTWYGRLRAVLTAVVLACLFAAAFLGPF